MQLIIAIHNGPSRDSKGRLAFGQVEGRASLVTSPVAVE